MPQKRLFIVIESINGAGGSTQADQLISHLIKDGYKVTPFHFHQRERGTGQLIQEKFLDTHNQATFSRREQALLYIQDFFTAKESMEEALKKSVVISDRFYTSTMAYQTVGLSGKTRKKMLSWINWLVAEGKSVLPKPDLVISLDTPSAVSLRHLKNQPKDFFENAKKLRAIRRSYLMLAREQKWTIINSMARGKQRSIQDIHAEVWQQVLPLIKGS